MKRWLAPLTILYGVVIFIWTTPEEQSAVFVALLGAVGGLLFVLHARNRWTWIARRAGHGWWRIVREIVILPAAVGALGAVWAAVLMFMKTALHNHLVPEYPLPVILSMAARAPVWAVAAIFIATGWRLAGVRSINRT